MSDSRSESVVASQRGASSEAGATGRRSPKPASPQFVLRLRGYHRIEVDHYIDGLLEENAALRQDLEALAALPDRAGTPPLPPSPTPPDYDDTPAEASLAFGAEQLLRLAEQEASELRTRATRNVEAVEAAARQSAKEQLRVAGKQAETIRSRAAEEAARVKTEAFQEAARVGHVHRSIKGELRRLAEQLNAEAQRADPAAAPAWVEDPDAAP